MFYRWVEQGFLSLPILQRKSQEIKVAKRNSRGLLR